MNDQPNRATLEVVAVEPTMSGVWVKYHLWDHMRKTPALKESFISAGEIRRWSDMIDDKMNAALQDEIPFA